MAAMLEWAGGDNVTGDDDDGNGSAGNCVVDGNNAVTRW